MDLLELGITCLSLKRGITYIFFHYFLTITYIFFHYFLTIKVDSYDSLPIEKILTLHNVITLLSQL